MAAAVPVLLADADAGQRCFVIVDGQKRT